MEENEEHIGRKILISVSLLFLLENFYILEVAVCLRFDFAMGVVLLIY